jgi:ABC-type nickel/cobalt efflux system permease component RcnA
MKSLAPYVLAKRNLAMTILFMAVMTFLTIYVASTSLYFAIGFFVVVQSIGALMLRHYIKKVKELNRDHNA